MNFGKMTSFEVKEQIQRIRTAILPIGAVEAHGPHLPLVTDNILAEKLAERVAEETEAFILPTLPYGQVWSLRNFPGSITVSNESLIAMLVDIGVSLFKQGIKLFVMINGHLGNQPALKDAARVLLEKVPQLKVLYLFYPGTKEIIAEVKETPVLHGSFFHACELETSYMLYLAEEDVQMDKAICDIPTIPSRVDCTPTPWEEFTKTAVLGDATLATKEKGELVISKAVENMVAQIEEVKQRV